MSMFLELANPIDRDSVIGTRFFFEDFRKRNSTTLHFNCFVDHDRANWAHLHPRIIISRATVLFQRFENHKQCRWAACRVIEHQHWHRHRHRRLCFCFGGQQTNQSTKYITERCQCPFNRRFNVTFLLCPGKLLNFRRFLLSFTSCHSGNWFHYRSRLIGHAIFFLSFLSIDVCLRTKTANNGFSRKPCDRERIHANCLLAIAYKKRSTSWKLSQCRFVSELLCSYWFMCLVLSDHNLWKWRYLSLEFGQDGRTD